MTKRGSCVVVTLHFQNDIIHPDSQFRVGTGQSDSYRDGVIVAAKKLLKSARENAVPIIHGRIAFSADQHELIANCVLFKKIKEAGALVEGSWGANFYEKLGPVDGEIVVTHTRNNLFFDTDLSARLHALRAETLIFAGVATSFSVEHTARHAADIGYNVVIASDACTTADRSLHDGSLRVLSMLADIRSVDEIAAWFSCDQPSA